MPSPPFDWEVVWKSNVHSKLQIFIWRCAHNGLPLGSNLLKRQFKIDRICVFCGNEKEDADHLFLNCPKNRAAWFSLPWTLRSDVLLQNGFHSWFSELIRGLEHQDNPLINSCHIIWFCWAIYFHRNEVLFRNITPDPIKIVNIWQQQIDKEKFQSGCRGFDDQEFLL